MGPSTVHPSLVGIGNPIILYGLRPPFQDLLFWVSSVIKYVYHTNQFNDVSFLTYAFVMFYKNWFFVYLICGGMEEGYYVEDLDAIEQSCVVFLGRRRLIPYVCWGTSLTSSLPTATEGLLSQVPTCHASRCHRDSIQLLQAVLPQQICHGLSP